jgi:CPA2 family monovalent cation:H+ antiporter-2
VALGQIGEFSFILAEVGRGLGILDESATNTLIVAAIASISLNPILYRLVDKLEARAQRRPRLSRWLAGRRAHAGSQAATGLNSPSKVGPDAALVSRAVVVGYGPVGCTVARLLIDNNIKPTIVELNLETVRTLRAAGISAIYGDASHQDSLKEAGVAGAVALVLSASGLRGAREIIRLARELNPRIRVFARASFLREMADLKAAGADATFADEGEVALSIVVLLLRQLGAADEQIDRERDRIRDDLFGGPLSAEPLFPPEKASDPDDVG